MSRSDYILNGDDIMGNNNSIFEHTIPANSNIKIRRDQKSGEYIFTLYEEGQDNHKILLRLPHNSETYNPVNNILNKNR